ncbi:hypothetical protein JKP88DRAFT_244289 [Tribonema minus]|uniref:Uncharacterized protein n=1 Tax=Tribonema minus TaxID=303371 RepID=A0A836CJC4_9STRA|nr:hypothetical protein JKP88DRAFT_244289 [Tribonema minus]
MVLLLLALAVATVRQAGSAPCAVEQQALEVATVADIATLQEAVACTGGGVEATWLGRLQLESTIAVAAGTTLTIQGYSPALSAIDGSLQVRLFSVATEATLKLSSLSLLNGAGPIGGTILARNFSTVELDRVTVQGGSIVADAPTVAQAEAANHGSSSDLPGGLVFALFGSSELAQYRTLYTPSIVLPATRFCECMGSTCLLTTKNPPDLYGAVVSVGGTLSISGSTFLDLGRAQWPTYVPGASWAPSTYDVGSVRGGAVTALGTTSSLTVSASSFTRCTLIAVPDDEIPGDGGAICAGGGTVVMENVTFSDCSSQFGGAVYIEDAVTRINGANFNYNTALDSGGGLYLERSPASVTNTIFKFNSGGIACTVPNFKQTGGLYQSNIADAFYDLYEASEAANVIFHQPVWVCMCAVCVAAGGAVAVFDGQLSTSDCDFTSNKAFHGDGGAIRVQAGSSTSTALECSWESENSKFVGNKAAVSGGAAFISDACAARVASGHFINNEAASAGALRVGTGAGAIGSVLPGQTVQFAYNSANQTSGGAILVANIPNPDYFPITADFVNNTAQSYGGGIHAIDVAFLQVSGNFDGNVAASAGGALYLSASKQAATAVYMYQNATFTGNAAGADGGAMYMQSGAVGELEAVTFTSNRAGGGGGAVCLESGAALQVRGYCAFVGNMAMASAGGALLDLSRGANSSIVFDASSRLNGGIAEAGLTFEGNYAYCCHDGGYGLSAGRVAYARSCEDVDTAAGSICCGRGEYNSGAQCVACDGATTNCSILGITTESIPLLPGYWRESVALGQAYVKPCWNEDACVGGSATDVEVEESDAAGTPDAYCEEGYQGPSHVPPLCAAPQHLPAAPAHRRRARHYNEPVELCAPSRATYSWPSADCAVCADGYAATTGYSCYECTTSTVTTAVTITVAVVAALAGLLACALWLGWGLAGDDNPEPRELHGWRRVMAGVLTFLGRLRIPLVSAQLLVAFVSITGAQFPELYQSLVDAMSFVTLGMLFAPISCIVPTSFYQRLLAATLLPLAALAALCCVYAAACCVGRRRSAAGLSTAFQNACIKRVRQIVLLLAFVCFAPVSTVVFQTFVCDNDLENGSYLRADYSLSCDTSEHSQYKAYACAMSAVYPIGIPVFYGVVLWRQRKYLRRAPNSSPPCQVAASTAALTATDPMAVRKGSAKSCQGADAVPQLNDVEWPFTGDESVDSGLRATRFLWGPYRAGAFYWEVLECGRRLLLSGVLVFMWPGTASQGAIACVLAFVTAMIYGWAAPHADRAEATQFMLNAAILFLSMFSALITDPAISAHFSDGHSGSGDVMSALLIGLSAAVLALAALSAVLTVNAMMGDARGVRELPLPQRRPGADCAKGVAPRSAWDLQGRVLQQSEVTPAATV